MSQKPETPITVETIKQMSDEEVADLNKTLTKKLVRRMAINLAVTVTIAVGAHLICKKLDEKTEDETSENTETENTETE